MPFVKKLSTDAQAVTVAPGVTVSVTPAEHKAAIHKAIGGRDFDAEARGKTRCALEEAWAQSPLLPMLVKDPNDRAALHALLDEMVSERMKRVFPNG